MGWKEYTSEELESLIKQNPLNENGVDYVFKELINEVKFNHKNHPRYSIIFPAYKEGKDLGKFNIVIHTNGPQIELDGALVEELLHAYYRTQGPESIIKTEVERIVRENPALVKYIGKKYDSFLKRD